MVASKGEGEATTSTTQPPTSECCMCGDYGLSYELFRCKICQFRSQHRYCSNQYPKADSYKACNWCLARKDDSATVKTPNHSSNSSSSHDHHEDHAIKLKVNKKNPSDHLKKVSVVNSGGPIKKAVNRALPPEKGFPTVDGRKRSGGGGVVEEKNQVVLRKSKSENQISTGGGIIKTRQVFRNRVRRYKLLDEVSSQ